MSEIDNNMDKVFREKLGDFREQPPDEIWVGIKSGLGRKPARKILVPLWQAAAGMALLITAGSIFYFVNRSNQNQLSEQLILAPHNITSPEKVQKHKVIIPDNSGEAIASISGKKEKNTIIAEKIIEMPLSAQKTDSDIQIAQTSSNQAPALPENTIQIYSVANLNNLMPPAYSEPVKKDIILMKNRTVKANWDMLYADDAVFEENGNSDNRVLLSAQVSPTYSYRDIGNIGSASSEQLNFSESGKVGYSGGLQFGYKTSKRLSIHTGVMYAQLGYNINQLNSYSVNKQSLESEILFIPNDLESVYTVNNSIGVLQSAEGEAAVIKGNSDSGGGVISSIGDQPTVGGIPVDPNPVNGKIEQFFQYLEVPFMVRYTIFDRKFGVNLLGGLSTNILMGNRATLTSGGESSDLGSTQSIRAVNYMGNVGLGFDYAINKNLLFTVEPQFKYFLNSINESNLISNRPYTMGMFTGVKFIW